jgi:hypothetical protein
MRTPKRVIVESIGGHAFVDLFLPCGPRERNAPPWRHAQGRVAVTGSFSGFFEVEPDEPVTAEPVGSARPKRHS